MVGAALGCSRVNLLSTKPPKVDVSSDYSQILSGTGTFELSAPKTESGYRRIVIFLDMSFSMLSANCEGDVNNPSEPVNPSAGVKPVKATSPAGSCRAADLATGRDPSGERFALVKDWLAPLASDPNAKFMIVPFTGGILERSRPRVLKFGTYEEATAMLNTLKNEQAQDKRVFTNPALVPASMGTSVPLTRLNLMTDAIYAEMETQKNNGELVSTTYDVIYLSDGVPTPTPAHYQTALNLVRLPTGKICNPDCVNNPAACRPFDYDDRGRCSQARQEMAELWGDVRDNQINTNLRQWRFLMGLPNVFMRGKINLHLAILHPETIAAADQTPATNFLHALRASDSTAKWSEIRGAVPPYSLVESGPRFERYTIRQLFVVNPNVRVNPFGRQALDSDGDGLFDEDEIKLGTDPLKARTSGFCLDVLSTQAAYKARCQSDPTALQCDPLSDPDGDGLNDCEEKVLGTSSRAVDSDGDGIPDGLEVIYGFNPLRADNAQDSNADGMINLER